MHAAYVCVHVRRHLRSFTAVRAFKLRLLPALEPHVFLHVAQVLVAVAALGTPKPPLSVVSLPLFRRVLGVPIGPEAVGIGRELNRVHETVDVNLRRGSCGMKKMLVQRDRVVIVGTLLLLILNNS